MYNFAVSSSVVYKGLGQLFSLNLRNLGALSIFVCTYVHTVYCNAVNLQIPRTSIALGSRLFRIAAPLQLSATLFVSQSVHP